MTPSHKAKLAAIKGRSLEVGDAGFWITCQRQKEVRAADEILSICNDVRKTLLSRHIPWDDLTLTMQESQYGRKLFGIDAGAGTGNDWGDAADEEPEDIEAAIEKEIAALKPANKPKSGPFDLLRMNVDCVLFMRTRLPVDPLRLVREVCQDASVLADRSQWRSRFINKLTPISYTAKATEKGLEELVEKILPGHFRLAKNETKTTASGEDGSCSVSISPIPFAPRLYYDD
jgi:tRNA acetyltransferase TAN1